MCLVYTTYSQAPKSTRMVLVEEATSASCSFCGQYNPAFNTLLQANTSKVISIKYQGRVGYDPMYNQNRTEVDTRDAYYSLTSQPNCVVDGNYFKGHIGNVRQSKLDSAAAISAPFTIDLTHHLSSDYDSVFITVVITATENISFPGPLVAQVVITENEINYCNAPGTNGETDFYNVMRKMLPGTSGTTLPLSWTIGQTQTLNFAVPVPAYFYDVSNLAVVAFVQDNSDKDVKQAAFSAPQPLTLDAGMPCNAITNIAVLNCQQTITPHVSIKNFRTVVITSATIKYKIDSNGDSTYNWNGNLASGASAAITLPQLTVPAGTHTLTVSVNNPNGNSDYNTVNNSASQIFNIIQTYLPMPITESFASTTFPPTNWINEDVEKDAVGWSRKSGYGGFGQSTSCAKIDFWTSSTNYIDYLYAPPLNLSGTSTAFVVFDYAYAQYNTGSADKIEVQVSTTCGGSWASKWSKAGSTLATRAATTSPYEAPAAGDWKSTFVDLSSYAGQSSVFVRFAGISDYGNNAYIDDIQIVQTNPFASISENTENASIVIYPNPFNDYTNIFINLVQQADVNYKVFNITGSLVYSEDAGLLNSGNHFLRFNSDNLTSGIYFIRIMIGNEMITKKISINK